LVENDFNSSATWIASSLVGVRISAWRSREFLSILSRIGSQNAAVFPDPVWACPTISLSVFNARGITQAWIGEGFLYPFSSIDFKISLESPKDSKVISVIKKINI